LLLIEKPRFDGSEDDYDMEAMHDDDDESWVRFEMKRLGFLFPKMLPRIHIYREIRT